MEISKAENKKEVFVSGNIMTCYSVDLHTNKVRSCIAIKLSEIEFWRIASIDNREGKIIRLIISMRSGNLHTFAKTYNLEMIASILAEHFK
jgi:hypothetical protein